MKPKLFRRVLHEHRDALRTVGRFTGCKAVVICHCAEYPSPHFHWCKRKATTGDYCGQHRLATKERIET